MGDDHLYLVFLLLQHLLQLGLLLFQVLEQSQLLQLLSFKFLILYKRFGDGEHDNAGTLKQSHKEHPYSS